MSLHNKPPRTYSFKRMAGAIAAIALSVLVSGCVVVPAYGPHYYHPYRPYYW